MTTLFEASKRIDDVPGPLADRLRPKRLDEVVGQEHLLGSSGPLKRMIEARRLASIILWGPPGCGKTTIARLLADETEYEFVQLSAVFSGVTDLRKVFDEARLRRLEGRGTLLFVDEIHRFNKSQQDGFLPVVEDGTIILIGATTENPSFELNAPLLSRCQVFVLHRLADDMLEELLTRAESLFGGTLPLDGNARASLRAMSDGDGRYVLNMAQDLLNLPRTPSLDTQALVKVIQRRSPVYDKGRESHYNLISALHKSLRGSDVDAALYWLSRMLSAGEDPLYIIRRMVRFAVEDIGLADPGALVQALAAKDAYEFIGAPEGELAIVQCIIYLATAPKSNATYRAEIEARNAARESGSLMPPPHILNAPTQLMKEMGYGKGYLYDHDTEGGFSGQNYFPVDYPRRTFYEPSKRGFEREITDRLEYLRLQRERRKQDTGNYDLGGDKNDG